ncbi:putative membrane protein (TIGR02226 family) [Lutibacter sp. Hel_I_33_5]|uniref:BatA domain-containing protein n=1 Tax=Lutibacter sp. Hel_I_33_5 TaxID=1566289 RepID=UPI0011A3011B|nr:BatA domain-containing protein [Lutibacter sp. Hel_I_33_5]TVZ55288.1 putative membrane protein (TIGR02226 family) [Lutibacter sp. Hel_I_33_5]
MQFKYPQILYLLALLIIPILVHLFQLQKFKKTPFTNVAFLKKITLQTRKSSQLKKWLILANRLLLFSAILFAFSQPYFSNKKVEQKQNNFIYLDNSLSLNSKGEKGDLLQVSIQEIIENISSQDKFNLLTNDDYYTDLTSEELKKKLLKVKNTSNTLKISDVLLKIDNSTSNKTNTLNKNILISDFQNTYKNEFTNVNSDISFIKLNSSLKNNISIDSVYIDDLKANNFTVKIIVKNQGEEKTNIPIALFNKKKLISKQSFSIEKNTIKTLSFPTQKTTKFTGKITVTFNDTFTFDNSYFFTINSNKKSNILTIGKEADFISKIYQKEEFNLSQFSLQNLNYNTITNQHLIILNELTEVPKYLSTSLQEFSKNGGTIIIIPSENIKVDSYNQFFKDLNLGKVNTLKKDSLKITSINFNHPIFNNVFSKNIKNFQYPVSNSYYPTLFRNSNNIVSYQNNTGFIKEIKLKKSTLYWASSSLDKRISNFTNSPLIVPIFYNIGLNSLKYPKLYYTIGEANKIDISGKLSSNDIITITDKEDSFIPLQQSYQNKTTINTEKRPNSNGFKYIINKKDTLKTAAYNYPKHESRLQFLDLNALKKEKSNITIHSSIEDVFKEMNKKNEVRWLWKWFLALAIVSLLLEILILKFFKP